MKNTDLHMHSYYSDGHLSPRNLVRLAKKKGVKNMALTDHNTVRGVREAVEEGKRLGIKIIPGVEFMAEEMIEILGYFVDIKNRELIENMNKNRSSKKEKIKNLGRRLKITGNRFLFKDSESAFFPLYQFGLRTYGKILEKTKKIRKNTIGVGVSGNLSVVDSIKLIKRAGGVPILAHPWLYYWILEEKKIAELVKAGLKGIEFENGDCNKRKTKEQEKKMRELGKKYKLIFTCGSDYHGLNLIKGLNDDNELGRVLCDEKVVEELEKLKKCKLN